MTADKQRQDAQPAFVLHTYPYLETSLIVEAFTRNFGRIALVAKGAKRPKSTLRGLLLAFQPLQLSWGGKSELRTLYKAEWQGGQRSLQGTGLICGFYLNELLVRLLHRNDPHEQLFVYYQEALAALSMQTDYIPILRRFEQRLLQELGYALTLNHDIASGKPIDPDKDYSYEIERGPVEFNGGSRHHGLPVRGSTLLDMERGDYSDTLTRQQSKTLMRYILNHYLGDQPLHTRQLLKDLQQL
ncbi:DNA repair protein RecO [Nitrosovibrio sp. Nv6]|uniref:DNA repair protein RecO n=1 Tax=Nitrosovibrio sp. Nv6 TaxID=1855340 RepID=UPI0008D896E4|nr:DNA repair protein RecO [Nitrosovibrio sp. Nv6]SEO68484.1 DNA replication and repair protein RecO [Nitrosovibrio sp. Nv6]